MTFLTLHYTGKAAHTNVSNIIIAIIVLVFFDKQYLNEITRLMGVDVIKVLLN
jgi:hypothetical protein